MECELSPAMATIQQALVTILDSMLRQVQRTHQLDTAELNLGHAFSKNFDTTIKQQLDPVWNTLTNTTRTQVRCLLPACAFL